MSFLSSTFSTIRHLRFEVDHHTTSSSPRLLSVLKLPKAVAASSARPFSTGRIQFAPFSAGPTRKMEVKLSAPNGITWTQPVGLFINNEFVQSSNGQKLTTVNPA
jgi:aldehyde dehydrogenase (NAD(P)+)